MVEDPNLDHVTVGIAIENALLTPEQISQRIGTQWDKAQRIGDPRGHTGKKWGCNVWQILERQHGDTDTNAHDLLPMCLAAFLPRLKAISTNLREIDESVQFFIHVTAKSVPGITLVPEILRVLADAGLSLDIDRPLRIRRRLTQA